MSDPTRFHPFTDLVDMSPDAIERRIKEVFDLNRMCDWLGQAEPVVREEPETYNTRLRDSDRSTS